jgi:hypothetical protein
MRIMLELVVNRMGGYGLDSSGSGCRPVAGSRGHDSELSGSMKVGNFLTNSATVTFSRRTPQLIGRTAENIWT